MTIDSKPPLTNRFQSLDLLNAFRRVCVPSVLAQVGVPSLGMDELCLGAQN